MVENGQGLDEPWSGIEVYCDCGHLFRVPTSLKAGLTNCPRCKKAVAVPGGPEAFFWILLGLGILAVLTPAAILFASGSPGAGIAVVVAGAVVIGVVVLAS